MEITLKLFEIRDLNAEINGLVNMQSGEKIKKGLLDETLSMTQKYWLSNLGTKAKELTDEVEPLRQELIQKWGDKTGEDTIEVLPWKDETKQDGTITKVSNPKFFEFEKEYTELFSQERSIDYKQFWIEDFDGVKSENDYPVFRKFCASREDSPLQVVK